MYYLLSEREIYLYSHVNIFKLYIMKKFLFRSIKCIKKSFEGFFNKKVEINRKNNQTKFISRLTNGGPRA